MSDDTVDKINRAERNLTKSGDMKEEMAMMMAPYANWEQFLVPAPITIALLGELMLISTRKDFSLEKKPPKDGFKLLKYPGSFRASLVQVSNEGWEAFNIAHKNMDQIRLLSGNVPDNLKKAVQVLLKGDSADIEDILPIELGAIKTVANKCLRLATGVEEKFVSVMALTGELLEACVNAKGEYEQEYRDTVIQLQVADTHKTAIAEDKKRAEESREMLKQSLNDAEKGYKDAMDSFPSGWDMIGMNFVEGITSSVTNCLEGLTTALTMRAMPGKGKGKAVAAKGATPAIEISNESPLDSNTAMAYSKAIQMKPHVDYLSNTYLSGDKLNSKAIPKTDVSVKVSAQVQRLQKDTAKLKESATKKQVLDLCKSALGVCSQLKDISRDFHEDSDITEPLAKKLNQLDTDMMSLVMEGKMLSGGNALDPISPNQAAMKAQGGESQSGGTAAAMATQNARFKAELAANNLQNTRDNYTKSCDKLSESTHKLADIMRDIAKLDLQKIDFQQIKETLVKGIRALGELREQWSKLVAFFQMMSNIIECCLAVSLNNFLEYANTSSERALEGYTISNFRKDLIYHQAFQCAKIAYLVNMISGSYVEVSHNHIMDRIAGLAKLLALDPDQDAAKIRQEMHKLTSGCTEAQEGIRDIVMKNKTQFDAQIASRMKKIQGEMQSALPPIDGDEPAAKRIKKAAVQTKKVVEKAKISTSDFDVDDLI